MAETKIKTSGLNSARTLNNLSKQGITVKNACRDGNVLVFSVHERRKSQTVQSLNSMNLESESKDKFNMFNRLFSLWRFGIILAVIVCIVIYSVLSSFILKIDVSGTTESTKKEIENFLKVNSFYVGITKNALKTEELDQILLEKFDFSVVESKIVGTTLCVNIKEELTKPDYYDTTQIKRMISSEDALITRIVCVQGTQSVVVGKSVKKGQTLIDSLKNVGDISIPIRAIGEVYGKVWREKEVFIPSEKIVYKPTGQVKNCYAIRLGDLSSSVEPSPFEFYTVNKTSIKIGDFLPIYRDCYQYVEQIPYYEPNDENVSSVIEKTKKEILLDTEDEEGVLIRVWSEERVTDSGKYLKVIAEFEKRIDKYA